MLQEAGRRSTSPASRLPIAVSPTPAVLPIRQTSTQSRPAGIDLPISPLVPGVDAFHPSTTTSPMVPIAIPAPPAAPPELAAPVAPALDPAVWGLDIKAAPGTGRRRGSLEAEPDRRGGRKGPADPNLSLSGRLLGRGKSGAARLLVLALVVGAEGVAITSMAGTAHTAPADPSTAGVSNTFELTAGPAPVARPATASTPAATGLTPQQQRADLAVQQATVELQRAQAAAAQGKVTAAIAQAQAAAKRVKAAADRREKTIRTAMRNAQSNPQAVARVLASERGWGSAQFSCLVPLWNRESGWNFRATNAGSGAYGIPQSLPADKMATAGADWRTNPVTQIKWGLDYIAGRYGTPCGAWAHETADGSY